MAIRKSGIRMTKDESARVLKAISAMSKKQVFVGISDPFQALKAYVHENGSAAKNIPARPFIGPGMEAAREEIADQFIAGAGALLDNSEAGIDRFLHAAGRSAVAHIKEAIDSGEFAPLDPRTLAARARRGNDSAKPLDDTGTMRDSFEHKLEAPE